MAIYDLYWKRQQRLRGEVPDVYTYDQLPKTLRVQIVQILRSVLGDVKFTIDSDPLFRNYKELVGIICNELGVFHLAQPYHDNQTYDAELFAYFLAEEHCERALSVVEIAFFKARTLRLHPRDERRVVDVVNAASELNARFKEHGVGYQLESGEIVRVDSELLHSEAVKPALRLLGNSGFEGPLEEYLKAHECYRHGDNETALTEANKAFESTMKVICDKQGWSYDPKDTASKLIAVCFDNGLIDAFWKTHLAGLRSTLEACIPTARNKLAGHGQGPIPREVPPEIVTYIMHMTASTIVFLIQASKLG